MAVTSKPGVKMRTKVVKAAQNSRHSTVSTNKHRFQSFSERIARVRIDPVRRRRNTTDHEELFDATSTYFGQSLEKWRDLNLSQTFTRFVREAGKLCDSLPMVLYNENKIMDLLMAAVAEGDELALEPLLDLTAQFAQDLDTRFEGHFKRAVTTIMAAAAKHPDPAVVEWCFTCLAWLFKYLSRLLAPDLRPLYDMISPYLGKHDQKPFIVRFAAESLSFLLRKAASTYDRNPEPLDRVMAHIFNDCARTSNESPIELQQQGIMVLLTETIKSVQNGLHSNGINVLKSALIEANVILHKEAPSGMEILLGCITSLIHHTNQHTFPPIQDAIVETVATITIDRNLRSLEFSARLIFIIASVRKGSRVTEWLPLVKTLRELVQMVEQQSGSDSTAKKLILSALAVVFQEAPVEIVLSNADLLAALQAASWSDYFLGFCDFFSRLGKQRFKDIILPHFYSFVLKCPARQYDSIGLLTMRLDQMGIDTKLRYSEDMLEAMISRIKEVPKVLQQPDPDTLFLANLALTTLQHGEQEKEYFHSFANELLDQVKVALTRKDNEHSVYDDFATTSGLAALLTNGMVQVDLQHLWHSLCNESGRFVSLPAFWKNICDYITFYSPKISSISDQSLQQFETSLVWCLTLPSHDARRSALDVIRYIYEARGKSVPPIVTAAITIETTQISLDSSRSMSMNVRRFASELISSTEEDEFLRRSMTAYCFGIMHFRLAQAWDDATDALLEVSKTSVGDSTIAWLLEQWLEATKCTAERPSKEDTPLLNIESTGFRVVSDFECSHLAKLTAIYSQTIDPSILKEQITQVQGQPQYEHLYIDFDHLRDQALRILNKLPKLAEKRSRFLVPILLRWADKINDNAHTANPREKYSRKHQKALLAVFAQFTNPKVLYRSNEVHTALVRLCAHGDVEIQRSALTAILAWKEPGIVKYEENLRNLLDEAQFRDEISSFIQSREPGSLCEKPESYPQLMPVLLRLLYGRVITAGQQMQGSRRRAVLIALSIYDNSVIEMLIDIILEGVPIQYRSETTGFGQVDLQPFEMPLKKQLGMLNMIDDMVQTLGPRIEPFCERVLQSILVCAITASRRLESANDKSTLEDHTILRTLRQSGLQSLVKMFSSFDEIFFIPYMSIVFQGLIRPRLANFASEQAQSVSALLRILAIWTNSEAASRFVVEHDEILVRVQELICSPNTKDEVRLFILSDIFSRLLESDREGSLLGEHVATFTRSIGLVLHLQPSIEVVDACVGSLALLAGRIGTETEAQEVIKVSTSLLARPSREVPPRTKTGLLRTIDPIVNNFKITIEERLYASMCALFSRVKQSEVRVLLSTVFRNLCQVDGDLAKSADICANLNAVSRLGEPDHDRRENGFVNIIQNCGTFTSPQWRPILSNCLFYIRDADDLVNRTSAAQALRRFIDSASSHIENKRHLIAELLVPGLEYGMKEQSELVRSEYLNLLNHLINSDIGWTSLEALRPLTVEGDEEASFFTNILHIQQHRRLRALRRLADEADKLSSQNVVKIFLPLLEHFVFDAASGDAGRTLADQTMVTIGAISTALSWSSFRGTFKRYASLLKARDDAEKIILRLLSALTDALRINFQQGGSVKDPEKASRIIGEFVPPLTDYLRDKDESTVDRRLGVTVTITKLLTLLPEDEVSGRLTPVLTHVCQILRSRSVEARDQARKTLTLTLSVIGTEYFGFILRELRSVLQKGSQLHVLSFSVHALLVHAVADMQPGALDNCVQELMMVIMNDIFGLVGQEKDAEEYKSAMKEVKSSKSYDTMEILAKVTPVRQLGHLVIPIQALLSEKLDSTKLRKVDDMLIRLRRGVDHNPGAESREMLMFCHEMARQVYIERQDPATGDSRLKPSKIQKPNWPGDRHTPNGKSRPNPHRFKLVSFAFDLTRKILRRHENLLTAANMHAFLPIAGDALVWGHEDVRISALRFLGAVMRLPMAELENNAPVYIEEAVALIKAASSINTDSARAALELLTAILREKQSVQIADRSVGAVLQAIKADIDEPDKQGIIYKFIRTVLARGVMATEVYEIMDEVGKVIVINPDRNVKESARSAYLQFIINYPQGKDRWNKQAAFLVENLKYEGATGRQSVMELLHQLIIKLGDEVIEKLNLTFFIALVPVQVSDDDQACRQMATLLIGKIFGRASPEVLVTMVSLMNKWLQNDGNSTIRVAALQCWQTLIQNAPPDRRQLMNLCKELGEMLDTVAPESVVLVHILRTFAALVQYVPDVAFSVEMSRIWESIEGAIGCPQPETRLVAADILEAYFSDLARATVKNSGGLSTVPLRGSYGLELDGDQMRGLCIRSLRAIQADSSNVSEELAEKVVRHLVFIGRCFDANSLSWRDSATEPEDDNDDEEKGDEDANTAQTTQDTSALGYLFSRLSYIVRQDRFSTVSRTAALQCLAALTQQLDQVPQVTITIRSLYLLVDPSIPQSSDEAHQGLVDKARELLEAIQKKVGAEQYLTALAAARSTALEKRESRRQKRRFDAVSAPERWARSKKRKHENQRAKLKARAAEARGRRRQW